jgi:hypothetical protein
LTFRPEKAVRIGRLSTLENAWQTLAGACLRAWERIVLSAAHAVTAAQHSFLLQEIAFGAPLPSQRLQWWPIALVYRAMNRDAAALQLNLVKSPRHD